MVSLLIAFVISCLFIWHSATQYTQPTYGGESLSAWLAQYETNLLRDDMESLAHGAEAARAIRAIGSNAIPFLLKMLEVTNSQTDAILKKVFSRSHTPADVINARASRGFEILGENGKDAVPGIINIFDRHLSVSSQSCCAEALGGIGTAARSAVPTLLRYISSTNGDRMARLHCLYSLAYIDGQSDSTISFLERAVGDNDVHVARVALKGLRIVGAKAASALPLLLSLSTNNDSVLRLEAIAAISNIRTSPEIEVQNLILCLNDSQPLIRMAAAESLGRFKADARAAIPALTEMLRDGNPQCQMAAKEALAYIEASGKGVAH